MGYPFLKIVEINDAAHRLQHALEDIGRGDVAARVAILIINFLIEDLEGEGDKDALDVMRRYRDQAIHMMEELDEQRTQEKENDKNDFPPVMVVNRNEEDIVH